MRDSAGMLIVDDDPNVLEFLRESLADRGFEVETHLSAHQALETIERRQFDIVITDMHLLGTSGLDLLRTIVQRRPAQRVVAMSAFGGIELAAAAIRAGACDFIAKPFTIDALVDVVGRVVRSTQPVAPF